MDEVKTLRSTAAWAEIIDELKFTLSRRRDVEMMTHKDLYVTEAIRCAVRPSEVYPEASIVFTGGTALAKLSILRRFSEDVDVNVVPPPGQEFGSSRRKKIRKELQGRLDAGIPLPIVHERSGSNFAKSTLKYPDAGVAADPTVANFGVVLVEMNIRGQVPGMCSKQQVRSLASEAAERLDTALLDEHPILQPFEVLTADPLVAVVDKLDALHWRSDSDNPWHVKHRTRDVYDLAFLLRHESVWPRLNSELVAEMHATVLEEMPSGLSNRLAERPAAGFGASPAFQPGHEACERLRQEYPKLRGFVYSDDDWIEFDDALAIIHGNNDLL